MVAPIWRMDRRMDGLSAVVTLQSSINVTVADWITSGCKIMSMRDRSPTPVCRQAKMTAVGDGDAVDRHPVAHHQEVTATETGAGLVPIHQTQEVVTKSGPGSARDWGARGEAGTKCSEVFLFL